MSRTSRGTAAQRSDSPTSFAANVAALAVVARRHVAAAGAVQRTDELGRVIDRSTTTPHPSPSPSYQSEARTP